MQFNKACYVLLVLSVLLSGCGGADRSDVRSPSPNGPPPAAESETSGTSEIPVRLASWEEVEQLIASQKGKVVVLDVWSTWCVPCLREFPGLVEFHKKYGQQIACISVNCNYTGAEGETPEDTRQEIETFLKKQGAHFDNIISTTPDEQVLAAVGAAAVPIVRVYDKQGVLRKQFVNEDDEYGDEGFTYERHIEPLVEELLNE